MKFQCLVVLIVVLVTTQAFNEEVERKLDTSGPRPILKGLNSLCKKYSNCNYCPYGLKLDMNQLCSLFYKTISKSKSSKREEGDESERNDEEERNLEELLENLEEKIKNV